MSECPFHGYSCEYCTSNPDCLPAKIFEQNKKILALLDKLNQKPK